MDAQPDLSTLTDAELKELIRQLTEEEREVSKARRVLHGRIELAKSELIGRLRGRSTCGRRCCGTRIRGSTS